MSSTAPGAPAPAPTTVAAGGDAKASAWRQRLQQLAALGGLVLIFAAFSIASPQVFPTYSNITNILFSAVVVGVLSLGATFVIITGGIDLSCGTGMILSGVMAATFIVTWGLPVWLGIVLAILFGGLIGLVNGVNVAIAGLPPFIATLAMMLVAGGLALVISNKAPIYFDSQDHSSFTALSTGNLIPGSGFPNAVIVLLVAAVIAYVILSKTILGRYDISIGSNMEATALSGINVKKWLIIIYSLAGTFSGLAGVMLAARLGSAQPTGGQGYELQAIAAVVIGGTSLSGGKGSIVGTVIGAMIIAVINNGLQIISVPQEWQNVILGVVIVVTVFIDQLRTRRTTTT
ncbi:MAG: ABC transporter permease [Propionicimonas sp.]|nr:ABC transporter permease [Propionicimonas sp.]